MSLNLLLFSRSGCIRTPPHIIKGFHSTALAAATLKGKREEPKWKQRGKVSKGPKTHNNRTSSRIRLVKDLKPKGFLGKYEVAKAVSQSHANNGSTNKDAPSLKNKGKAPIHVIEAKEKSEVEAAIDEEFDRSPIPIKEPLLTSFSSPPLTPALSQSMIDILGPNAVPTPIQALSLKHLSSISDRPLEWKEVLLASETGSGKSFAYLLPLLQYLKSTEALASAKNTPSSAPLNPRALVLAPTHELTRQLSETAKSLVHHAKLRVLCASRANTPNTALGRNNGNSSARQMKHVIDSLSKEEGDGGLDIRMQPTSGNHLVDVLVSTPVKALEMIRGWGWDKVGKPEFEREGKKFRPGKPEIDLRRVECVVVDEADVLFDPDFRETVQGILSEISRARGHPIPSKTKIDNKSVAGPVKYPFHLILTSATIPASLSSYLSTHHPTLTRLASPRLHKLPPTLHTEYVAWTGGNRFADIERRLRRVWAEDALRNGSGGGRGTPLSRVLIFCNRSTAVDALGEHLASRGIENVRLTSTGAARVRGSNRHLDGFVKGSGGGSGSSSSVASTSTSTSTSNIKSESRSGNGTNTSSSSPEDKEKAKSSPSSSPRVLITTSLLSRGLDFAPSVQHVFIVDSPRNMIDFLHRAGRSGRAGHQGRVVIFGKQKGRGSASDEVVRKKIKALV